MDADEVAGVRIHSSSTSESAGSGRSSEDIEMADVEEHAAPLSSGSTAVGSTSTLAKFKAAQDLKIQTVNLTEAPTNTATAKSTTGSATSTLTTPSTDTSSSVTPQTPVPPMSTGKKRRRRTAAQIDRKHHCNYPGCNKSYGSEGSLTQHQRLKHRQQPSDPLSAVHSNQIGAYFLPLHRSASHRTLPPSIYQRPAVASTPGTSRNVTIRPATMEGLMGPPLAFDPLAEGDLSFAAFPDASSSANRQNLRARSNSMPVTYSTTHPTLLKSASNPVQTVTTRPQSTRKARSSTTPRTRAAMSNRRVKSRSKSESLAEEEQLMPREELERPVRERCASDGMVLQGNHPSERPAKALCHSSSFSEISSTTAASTATTSQSLYWPSVPATPHEEDIDSDILSLLVGSEASDGSGDDSSLCSPYMTPFTGNDARDGMDMGFNLSDAIDAMAVPKIKISTDAMKTESWLEASEEDALFLSNHIERMNVTTPHASDNADRCRKLDVTQQQPSRYDCESVMPEFTEVSIESCSVQPLNDMLPPQNSNNTSFTSATVTAADHQVEWMKDFTSASCFPAVDLDTALYMEDDMTPAPVLDWRMAVYPEQYSSGKASTGLMFENSDTTVVTSSTERTALTTTTTMTTSNQFGDVLMLDSNDFAVEETRLSSPLMLSHGENL